MTAEEQDGAIPFLSWERQHFIKLVPGRVCEYGTVEADIAALAKRYKIRALLFDPKFAEELTQRLADQHGIPRISFPQTSTNLTGPTGEFERLILSRQIEHSDNGVMNWQIANAVAKPVMGGGIRIVKETEHSIKRVDGPQAAVMALAGCIQNLTAEPTQSVYETKNLFVLGGDPDDYSDDGTEYLGPDRSWVRGADGRMPEKWIDVN